MAKAVLCWGLFIYTVTIPFMVWRLATREVKPAAFHTQAIVLAPCSLCLVSYLNVVKEPITAVVAILTVCVMASLTFIVIKLPAFYSVPFAPGFAGLTFPMAIGIVASNKASAYFGGIGQEALSNVIKQIAGFQIYLTTAIIGMVLLRFFLMWRDSMKQAA